MTNRPHFTARTLFDPELGCETIELAYHDPAHPNRGIVAGIVPRHGANLARLRRGSFDLIHTEPDLLREAGWTGCFVLWPIPNRVRNMTYRFHGKEYRVEGIARPGGDPNLVHGLVLDRAWQHDEPETGEDSTSVRLWIDITPDAPRFEAYPFPSRLELVYRLDAHSITISYAATNLGDETMPHGFALHPYFCALSGPDRTRVTLPAEWVMEADDALLPTGRLLPVDTVMYGPFDLREPRATGPLRFDHVYTGWDPMEGTTVDLPDQGFSVRGTASAEFTHAVIYTLGSPDWFCLEHQTCATDAANLVAGGHADVAHLLEIEPGGTQKGHIRYRFEPLSHTV